MTTKLQTYTKYPPARRARAGKPSGIDWLGDIPEEWTLKRNRFLGTYQKGKTADICTSDEKDCLPYLSAEVIRGSKEPEFCRGFVVAREKQTLLLWDGANAGEFFWAGPGVVSSTFSLILPQKRIIPKFYYWLLKGFERILRDYTQGMGIPHVSPWILKDSLLPEVPIKEQKRIAKFLDEKTKVVDELVAKKEKLIELLREKRAALITRAVTKGLDSNAKLKPSGIDWLGDIPEGWEVRKLKYLSTYVKTGSTPDSDQPEYFELGSIPWYTPGDFTDSVLITEATKYINNKAVSDGQSKLFKENSILLIGIGATLGKVGFSNTEFSANQQINVIYIKYQYLAKFYAYYLLGIRDVVVSTSNASTLGILNQEKTKQILCVVPSKKEQIEIVNYIDRKWDEFEKIVLKLAEQITKLKEYRSSLIYHAVTGKIKV